MSKGSLKTFMTGATGFLGNFLLRDLLEQGRMMVAMVRPPLEKSRERLHHCIEQIGMDLAKYLDSGQLVLVEGALPEDLPDLSDHGINDILSCAASLQLFGNGNEEPYRTNVEGTQNLIALARTLGVRHLHAVSSAYVCGSYTDRVREVFHHPRPDFQTEYERSKWFAELHFAEWGAEAGHALTVYRPSFLVGDSQSGYTSQYGGFYQLARMVSLIKQEYGAKDNGSSTYIPLRIPGSPEEPQNLVPVDFASRVIAHVMADESLHGRIYHLTDPTPPTNAEIKRYMEEYFKMHGGFFTGETEPNEGDGPPDTLLWEQSKIVTPRIFHNPYFEQDNMTRVIQKAGIDFPAMNQERFFTLIDFAIASRWGRGSNGKASGNGRVKTQSASGAAGDLATHS